MSNCCHRRCKNWLSIILLPGLSWFAGHMPSHTREPLGGRIISWLLNSWLFILVFKFNSDMVIREGGVEGCRFKYGHLVLWYGGHEILIISLVVCEGEIVAKCKTNLWINLIKKIYFSCSLHIYLCWCTKIWFSFFFYCGVTSIPFSDRVGVCMSSNDHT